mmetsp:Transcript_14661/g.34069  ORF Transcript_14661/g.34069 Transcript_14661/m.34069 type:complete len:601 (+) Transcript_14661:99-1901(+)|eukprot:CAMPEP_0197184776 /NCGR_PEP_ID=MMETSP1423-20130617/10552_1 /TAXON_ID=476441 /ORGANISM="Pseudo-nitzschia heimii, Strain UNC1101" /LENGTH=600 /DNA_ID=CAMNT_0042635675 /DNA_START=35 /DNA_END=1837 /DNA_ORIENTATION=+
MIRSRRISPTNSSESESPTPASPLNHKTLHGSCNVGHSSDDDNDDDIEGVSFGNGKEARRLFESRGKCIGLRTLAQRISKKELFILASMIVASNLAVGLLVYRYASTRTSAAVAAAQGLLQVQSSSLASASARSCPRDMTEFANWFADTLDPKRKRISQAFKNKASARKTKSFAHVPAEHYKTFYFDGKKISQPIARALRSRGWRKVDDTDHAHVIYTYSNNADWATDLHPWQRFNYIPGLEKWNQKANFAYYYKVHEVMTGNAPSMYVPESYMLTENTKEIEAFRTVLREKNGRNHPWVHKLSSVNQGRGITILAPNSPELLELPDASLRDLEKQKHKNSESSDEDEEELEESIVQRYICNEMTWNDRKFDVRMYWFVASLDPLIVLYHDGYVRVGNSAYSETSFGNTRSHLTSHTGLGAESKATFADLEEALNRHHRESARRSGVPPKVFPHNSTPVEHVRNQFKHALAEMVEIFRDESLLVPDYDKDDPEMTAENAFQFYCADFILDNDLDAWFIEPQNGCGLDEDYYFRLEMHASLFNGMVDVLEEIGRKQEQNDEGVLLPLERSGNWEILYADGQSFHYAGYERSKNKEGCKVRQ